MLESVKRAFLYSSPIPCPHPPPPPPIISQGLEDLCRNWRSCWCAWGPRTPGCASSSAAFPLSSPRAPCKAPHYGRSLDVCCLLWFVTVSSSPSQLFHRLSLNVDFSDVFPWLEFGGRMPQKWNAFVVTSSEGTEVRLMKLWWSSPSLTWQRGISRVLTSLCFPLSYTVIWKWVTGSKAHSSACVCVCARAHVWDRGGSQAPFLFT